MTARERSHRVRLGIAGLGAAGRAFVPAVLAHDRFTLAAVAEPDEEARGEVSSDSGACGFASLSAMLAGCDLDAVYIATPTELHGEHVMRACAAGKHVLTEKPMSTSVEGALAMVAAAERAGVLLLVGHSHSYDLPIKAMRDIIEGGTLGATRMIHTWCFSDWIWRPRRPDELKPELGGGVIYRQGAHQFDIIRLLGGGLLTSVRAAAFDWDPARPSIGAHAAWLQFADGATATAVYNGYGRLPGAELCFDVGEWGEPRLPGRARGAAPPFADDEIAAKRRRAKNAIPAGAPFQPFFGLTVVSCERGDIRQSPHGLYLYTDKGREERVLAADSNPRSLVLDEFAAAIRGDAVAVHDGRWGVATLEVCAAVLASARSGCEVKLKHQVAVPLACPARRPDGG
ncbi:MAG: Gfo/Idh/MocA family oxidoreductase, partial [Bradyrhizobiaceae bacterium]|nr:Gfo/Idh/MocA family oxidoreductase [Bradyrhizobiaceae bacterium]